MASNTSHNTQEVRTNASLSTFSTDILPIRMWVPVTALTGLEEVFPGHSLNESWLNTIFKYSKNRASDMVERAVTEL